MRVTELPTKQGALTVLDVRESWERRAGMISGSVHIPLGELPGRIAELPQGRPIVVVCRSGRRSARATAFLRARGFDAENLDGGMKAWAAAALPVAAAGDRGTVL